MSLNYSKFKYIILPIWVFFSFVAAQLLLTILVALAVFFDIPFRNINEAALNASLAAIMYILMLGIGVGIPILFKKMKISKDELGISRLPSWMDIIITPAGFIVYLILTAILMFVASELVSYLPWIDLNQSQDVGFNNIYRQFEYLLAFITLVIMAPVAEELLFRGFLFGKLKKYVPIWLAIVITSLLFGLIHGQWDLAIDTFALSVILCVLRLSTGSIWAPILLHMTKNGIAYYFLFINPTFLTKLIE